MIESAELAKISHVASRLGESGIDFRVYLFGSACHSLTPTDYDIAIIYRTSCDAETIRHAFNAIGCDFPVHMIFMTNREQEQLNFLESVNAEPLTLFEIERP